MTGRAYAARLIGRYFGSDERWSAIALIVLIAILRLGLTGVAVALNAWEKEFFDALGVRRADGLTRLAIAFFALGGATVAIAIADTYARDLLAIRWRRWLTANFVARWLARDRYLEIQRSALIDNPDQRIADDLRRLVTDTIDLGIGFVSFVSSAVMFGAVLWQRSSSIDIGPLRLPGDLVWYAVAYALIGSTIVLQFGPGLVRRTMQQQHYEADFRFLLVAIRRAAERIALMGLASGEQARLTGRFATIQRNFLALLRVRTGLRGVTSFFDLLCGVVPVAIVLPRYFDGRISLGDLVQVRGAFMAFATSLAWFIQAFPQIAGLMATINRVHALDCALEASAPDGIVHAVTSSDTIHMKALRIDLPTGRPLLNIGHWTIGLGERWLVRGASGVGKTTVIRALAGHWHHGSGHIAVPLAKRIVALPQQPYLPQDSIHALLGGSATTDDACRQALIAVRLDQLTDRLDSVDDWSRILSVGEQQRLAIAHILLVRPDFVLLDEATNAIDPDTVDAIYAALAAIPDVTVIDITHRTGRLGFYTHLATLADGCVTIGPMLR